MILRSIWQKRDVVVSSSRVEGENGCGRCVASHTARLPLAATSCFVGERAVGGSRLQDSAQGASSS